MILVAGEGNTTPCLNHTMVQNRGPGRCEGDRVENLGMPVLG